MLAIRPRLAFCILSRIGKISVHEFMDKLAESSSVKTGKRLDSSAHEFVAASQTNVLGSLLRVSRGFKSTASTRSRSHSARPEKDKLFSAPRSLSQNKLN